MSTTPTTTGQVLTTELGDGVVELTLSNPRRKNAVSLEMLSDLRDALRRLQTSAECRGIVLTGAAGDFCAGFDLTRVGGPNVPQLAADLLLEVVAAIRGAHAPVLAAIDGVAYGAGLGIALACDVRTGGEDVRLCMPVVKVGGAYPTELIGSFVDAVGLGRALDLFLTGRVVGADESERWGLLHRVAPAPREAARRLAAEMAAGHAQALHQVKRQFAAYRQATRPAPEARAELDRVLEGLRLGTDERYRAD